MGKRYTPSRGFYAGREFESEYAYRKQRDIDAGYSGYQRNKREADIPETVQADRWLEQAVNIGLITDVESGRQNVHLKELYHNAEKEGWKEVYGSHFDIWLRELEYHDADLGNTFDDESAKGKKK